ncbi:MAG: hypothetical protein HON98_04725 [Chloroflexi bacterium]|jgi:hypothetical protein|nr:hypothetical protein [Chloroflexota bacterium]MBT3671157.1 hypothetical protein [Chloroflexota bacterium]MBT4004254.1 hypothetical protein [Chloroflexota bacterium]MBT4304384.1 hypothetical protein [Chloroflexota bacterium]MBT4534403.1 hypothetical protein [Chloroflexota bacterium]
MKGTNSIYDAYALADKGYFDEAKLILSDTLEDNPGLIEGWLLLADLADASEEARECYQMIQEIDSNNWVSKKRLKLLLNQSPSPRKIIKPPIETTTLFDGSGPSLQQSFETHKDLLIWVGAGLFTLFMAGALVFFGVVGYLLWETNFLATI